MACAQSVTRGSGQRITGDDKRERLLSGRFLGPESGPPGAIMLLTVEERVMQECLCDADLYHSAAPSLHSHKRFQRRERSLT